MYVSAVAEVERVEHRADGTTETTTVTDRTYADIDAERYYVESTRGEELYGENGVCYFHDEDGEVHPSADRAHVTRRAVGGFVPYFHLTFDWTDAERRSDGTFTLSSDRPAGDGLPQVFWEEWLGVPQEGTLRLNSDGLIAGWTLASRRTFHRDGDQYVVFWTLENAVEYDDDDVPARLPDGAPDWTTGR